jgi:hypothetical protein
MYLDWLTWPGWDGVGAIVGIVALIAVGVAVADFMIRQSGEAPRAVAFTVRDSHTITNGRVDVAVLMRPMGPKVMYEARARVWGSDAIEPPTVPAIFASSDEPVEMPIRLLREELADMWVGLEWVEPKRVRSRAGASRIRLSDRCYQYWKPYTWWRWPRKYSGRWVTPKPTTRQNHPLAIP